MRHLLVLLAVLLAGSARAEVLAHIVSEKSRVELHREEGPCVGSARWALYVQGQTRISGCWILEGDSVQIAWLDGDTSRVPLRAFRKPEVL